MSRADSQACSPGESSTGCVGGGSCALRWLEEKSLEDEAGPIGTGMSQLFVKPNIWANSPPSSGFGKDWWPHGTSSTS